MQSYQNKRQVALNVISELAKIAQQTTSENQEAVKNMVGALHSEAIHLQRGELNTVVCGEAKRGKSSLINAFLDEPELCPVDAPVATNSASIIRYGEKERIVVHFEQSGSKGVASQEIQRSELASFVTEQGNERNKRKVKLVEISLVNQKLASGLVVTDTPGIGSLNPEHTAVTYETIPYSDAVVFVGSITKPLDEAEVKFVKDRIVKHTKHILYVMTMRDLSSNWQERLQEDIHLLAGVMGIPASEIHAVGVSSKRKLRFLNNQDPETLASSGFSEFEKELSLLLAQREDILLGRAQGAIFRAIDQLRLPWQAEKAALEAKSTEELEAIERDLKAMIARAGVLTLNSASWNSDLRTELRLLSNDCGAMLSDLFAELHRNADEYLQIRDYVEDPNKLGAMLSADCSSAFSQVVRHLDSQVSTIVQKLCDETSLTIERGQAAINGPREIQLRSLGQGPQESFIRKATNVGRSSAMNAMGLGAAGSIVGGVLGGILGVFGGPVGVMGGASLGAELGGAIGGLVGGLFGIKRGIEDQVERNLNYIRQNLRQEAHKQIDATHRSLSTQLQNLVTTLENEIHKDLMRKIQADLDSCKEAVAGFERAKQAKKSDFGAQLLDLNNRLKRLTQLEAAAQELIVEATKANVGASA